VLRARVELRILGAEGVECGEGCPSPQSKVYGHPCPDNFSILGLKRSSFGASWVLFFYS